jgi:predicted nucleic acid-binding protein
VRTVLDSSVLVAALVTPNPASASRIFLDRHLVDLAEVQGVRILRPGDFLVELRTRGG